MGTINVYATRTLRPARPVGRSMRAVRILLGALLALLLIPAAAQAQATVFGTEAPIGDALVDQPIEVGMKFRSDQDGYISALRFYKQANNTGQHVGHLWTASGQLLAEVPFTNETASGWQEQALPVPVPIARDTIYVTSYHSAQGRFGFSGNYFALSKDNPPLHAPASSLVGGNGVYRYGATSGFPTETFNATNYWVDAVFEPNSPLDTRPPKVSSTTPAAGATGVPLSSAVTVTFDEPLNPATVNAGSISLKDGAGNPVTAQVAYDGATQKATLTPQQPLVLGKTYTATVKSGSQGVTDVAGNQLAADHTWSFSTSADCPCTVFGAGEGPSGNAVQDQAVEVGMKFRSDEDGFITSLRFYKQAEQHGDARRAPVVGQRPAAGVPDVHQRDRLRVAAGEPAEPRPDHQGHDVHHLVPRERRSVRVDAGLLRPGRRPGPDARAA